MSLATQCPHCFTIFRVASDQLKLRGGLVRCGSCRQVFNGNEFLVEAGISDGFYHPVPGSHAQSSGMATVAVASAAPFVATPVVPPVTPPVVPPAVVPPAVANPTPPVVETPPAPRVNAPNPLEAEPKVFRSPTNPGYIPDLGAVHKPVVEPVPAPSKSTAAPQPEPEPAALYAEPHALYTDDAMAPADHDTPAAAAVLATKEVEAQEALHAEAQASDQEETESGDEENDEEDAEEEAPGFVQRAERRARLSNVAQVAMIILSAVMIPVLLLQATYYWRNQIAAAAPAMRPLLTGMCATFHCTVGLPTDIDRLSLESNELQVVPPNQNVYALSLVLRNRDSGPQAWPAIELTLNNDDEKPVIRRVFRPRDYLANPAQVDDGIGGASEQQIKISFELDNALVSGYRIYLFYP